MSGNTVEFNLMTFLENMSNYSRDPHVASRYMRRSTPSSPFIPDCDVIKNDDEMIIYVSLPGVEKHNINIEFRNTEVIISGEKYKPYNMEDMTGSTLTSSQINYGRFRLVKRIPLVITKPSECIKTTFVNGLLTLKIEFSPERDNFFTIDVDTIDT